MDDAIRLLAHLLTQDAAASQVPAADAYRLVRKILSTTEARIDIPENLRPTADFILLVS